MISNSMNDPIDIVYLWCDGNDPSFLREKNLALKNWGCPSSDSETGRMRYEDNDELKYSLRSVFTYLPWINHIFIISNKQTPSWLQENPQISIIDHSDIIPSELLPTFNSITIEMYIDQIPNLSEKFLLFNDDTFVNAHLPETFFFNKDKPIVRLVRDYNKWQFSSFKEAQQALSNNNISVHRKTMINSWLLYCSNHKKIEPFYILTHTIDAFTKTAFKQVLNIYPELKLFNRTPFRTSNNIQRILFQLEMQKSLGCELKIEKKLPFLAKKLPQFYKNKINCFEGTECEKTWCRIKNLNPKMFCLNSAHDASPETKIASKNLLNELFPTPSIFEKPSNK